MPSCGLTRARREDGLPALSTRVSHSLNPGYAFVHAFVHALVYAFVHAFAAASVFARFCHPNVPRSAIFP